MTTSNAPLPRGWRLFKNEGTWNLYFGCDQVGRVTASGGDFGTDFSSRRFRTMRAAVDELISAFEGWLDARNALVYDAPDGEEVFA